jgi:hypothetical protein
MIKQLIKKQENKNLKIFTNKTSNFSGKTKFNPEKSAEDISDKLIEIVKKNLSQHRI